MEAKFLGVPLAVWGGICLLIAAIFTIIWPRAKIAGNTTALRFFILRWFHVLVWLLLAAACFGWAAGIASAASLAGLAVYIMFLTALLSR